MKNILIALTISVVLAGCVKSCETIRCEIQDKAVAALVPAIASGLQCTNSAAIEKSLVELGAKAKICPMPSPLPAEMAASSLGSVACSALADLLIANFANVSIPAEWGCSADNAKALLKQVVDAQCAKL
jgi:hypothetical protein